MKLRAFWGLAASLLGALPACAPLALSRAAPAAVERHLVDAFELVGRISVSDGARAASMGLEWRHGASDDWLFLGPLGQIVARIEADAHGAVLYTGAPEPVRAASAQELMGQVLGVAPPVDGVEAWVQGVARPGARVRRLDDVGRPASVADAGWIIDYLEYAGPEPDARPRRLEANWGDARLKLVIDQWSVVP